MSESTKEKISSRRIWDEIPDELDELDEPFDTDLQKTLRALPHLVGYLHAAREFHKAASKVRDEEEALNEQALENEFQKALSNLNNDDDNDREPETETPLSTDTTTAEQVPETESRKAATEHNDAAGTALSDDAFDTTNDIPGQLQALDMSNGILNQVRTALSHLEKKQFHLRHLRRELQGISKDPWELVVELALPCVKDIFGILDQPFPHEQHVIGPIHKMAREPYQVSDHISLAAKDSMMRELNRDKRILNPDEYNEVEYNPLVEFDGQI
ncbi:hypothetical protein HD806DRAFT_484735 [Xylariaceae sp. AK1471]|nr:hypothetical protein HD806DRAFT_484735 [Xylariaceae sp. AK1471]